MASPPLMDDISEVDKTDLAHQLDLMNQKSAESLKNLTAAIDAVNARKYNIKSNVIEEYIIEPVSVEIFNKGYIDNRPDIRGIGNYRDPRVIGFLKKYSHEQRKAIAARQAVKGLIVIILYAYDRGNPHPEKYGYLVHKDGEMNAVRRAFQQEISKHTAGSTVFMLHGNGLEGRIVHSSVLSVIYDTFKADDDILYVGAMTENAFG